MWQLREKIPSSLTENSYCFKYDISLPLESFYEIVLVLRERVKNVAMRTTGYGHIGKKLSNFKYLTSKTGFRLLGDSNLHLNIQSSEYNSQLHKLIEPFVYEYTSKLGGSIRYKIAYYHLNCFYQ